MASFGTLNSGPHTFLAPGSSFCKAPSSCTDYWLKEAVLRV